MKQHPSIHAGKEVFTASIFGKLDGSSLRFEWHKKLAWHKLGTRHQLLPETHSTFGIAIKMFLDTLAGPLEQIARQKAWTNYTVFCEFWRQNSFAVFHEAAEPKRLSLIDVQVYKRGLIEPQEFLELFASLETPQFLGVHRFYADFVQMIKLNQLEGVTFEGIIGKRGGAHRPLMQKAKTQAWLDRVLTKFDAMRAAAILSSQSNQGSISSLMFEARDGGKGLEMKKAPEWTGGLFKFVWVSRDC